jgi:hypothetical protein
VSFSLTRRKVAKEVTTGCVEEEEVIAMEIH